MTPAHDKHAPDAGADPRAAGAGRHASAIAVLEGAVEPVVEDMGYELLRLEWLGSGKRRVMRIYLDHPEGVSVGDCSRMSRIIGNALDASEAAASEAAASEAAAGEGEPAGAEVDPTLLALLARPYTLEVSSPGVDRPLSKRRHFEDQVGGRVKVELWTPLEPEAGGAEQGNERKFHGRIAAVEADPEAPDDPRRGVVMIHDPERDRTLRVPLPRIRRANLVWEF